MFNRQAALDHLTHARKLTVKQLTANVGGLSDPGKMPWFGWSISAYRCKTGAKLRAAGKHTVCGHCFALKRRYVFSNVQDALARRLECYRDNPEWWAACMVALLERKAKGDIKFFRWFDSGDLQDGTMLDAILWIAEHTPNINHWLPTKEHDLLDERIDVRLHSRVLPNLTIRVSAHNKHDVLDRDRFYLPTSSVDAPTDKRGHRCPATPEHGCGDCRACWDYSIDNTDYKEI